METHFVRERSYHRKASPALRCLLPVCADVAQLAEQLICNQQVNGSSPLIGLSVAKYIFVQRFVDGFPSGQRGQTVNLLQVASVVRIHHHPFTTRGGAVWKLVGLITRRSQVQILSPLF